LNRRFAHYVVAAIALVTLILFASTAGAQDLDTPEQSEQREPPYEGQLLRLSEILGAVHYLRRLCDSEEGSLWRDEMVGILEAESPNPLRRSRIVDRFNRGFDSFRSVYRTCTPAAITAIDRYMDEGARIARDITARYGK
jgi:uncharacterized protein (TIGR02301 family)